MRTIQQIAYAKEFPMGPFIIKQPLPAGSLHQLSPFLLLHHAGPKEIKAGAQHGRIDPHPHTGFSPVTFVFSGEVFHKDSLGNEGLVTDGGVQWMNAGKGIIHSEGPSPEFIARGGTLEMIQLWINTPKKFKRDVATYQNIQKSDIPVIKSDDAKIELNLVAGEYANKKGPAKTQSPLTLLTATIEKDSTYEFSFPEGWNVGIYILSGTLTINQNEIEALHFATFSKEGGAIQIHTKEKSRLLILAGEPIQEPIATYGPFVMNTNEEIQQAIMDYQSGKMGELDY